MTFTLHPVRVETGTEDEEGRVAFADDRLVAVLVRLSDRHEELAGLRYYEHGFGAFNGHAHPDLRYLEAA